MWLFLLTDEFFPRRRIFQHRYFFFTAFGLKNTLYTCIGCRVLIVLTSTYAQNPYLNPLKILKVWASSKCSWADISFTLIFFVCLYSLYTCYHLQILGHIGDPFFPPSGALTLRRIGNFTQWILTQIGSMVTKKKWKEQYRGRTFQPPRAFVTIAVNKDGRKSEANIL